MSDGADVFRRGGKVGRIVRTPKGSRFEYDEAFFQKHAAEPGGLSTHLPYSRKAVETWGVNLHPYFAGLLPEGLRLKALVRRTKTSEDDLLTLLLAAGADCVGDIAVAPEGGTPAETAPSMDLDRVGEADFQDLLRRSLAYDGDRREPSVAGVQEKISAAKVSIPLRAGKLPRAYILKLNPPERPALLQNEDFFLRMAGACGLEVPAARLVRDKTGAFGLLVERFDRVPGDGPGTLVGLPQEDACQFLDRYPADKYRISCAEIAGGLAVCSAPLVEIGRFIRLTAYSYLIGNGDLHAKNVSLRTVPDGDRVELTPAYDLLSTLPYGDSKMALKLDGRDDHLTRACFLRFAGRFGVREAACRGILDELGEASPPWIARLEEIGLPERRTVQLRVLMTKRREELLRPRGM